MDKIKNRRDCSNELEDIASRLKLSKIEEALFFPKYFQVETSRICNSNCPYCAKNQWDKSVPFMSDDYFNKIVDELKNYSEWINWVCLARAGEPLLDKKLTKRINMIKNAGIKWVNISTNAGLLSEKKGKELLDSGLDELMISIDSINPEKYEKIKVGLKFEKVMNNILAFFEQRNKINKNAVIRIRAVIFESDHEEISQWKSYWDKIKMPQDRIYMKKPHNWGNQKIVNNSSELTEDLYHPCILPWSTLHITSMGKITICPMDYDGQMDLGNIMENSLYEIWHNECLQQIRDYHASGNRNVIPFCRGCKVFDPDFSLEDK